MSSFKVCLRAPEGKKEEFQGASGLFSISMGLKKILMQGRCLEETIKIINSTFSRCDIVLSDTLQRFNVLSENPEITEEKARERTLSIGGCWLEKNDLILQKITIPHRISRWDDWLNSSFYQEKYRFVSSLFEHDRVFQDRVQKSVSKYFNRQEKNQPLGATHDLTRMLLASKFVLEETAVMLLWCDIGYDFELHPSPRNDALVYVHALYQLGKPGIPKLRQSRVKILGSCGDVEVA